MTLQEVTDQQATAFFVRSAAWHGLVETDCNLAPDAQGTDAWFILESPWPDINRTARFLQLFDRELRRAHRAWQNAFPEGVQAALWESDLLEIRAEELITTKFMDALIECPPPLSDGHLEVVQSWTEGTTSVIAVPTDGLRSFLFQMPFSAFAYAVSVFAHPMHMRFHSQCDVEGIRYATGAAVGRELSGLLNGQWAGSNRGEFHEAEINGRPTVRGPIGAPPNGRTARLGLVTTSSRPKDSCVVTATLGTEPVNILHYRGQILAAGK
ncbi:hypothetical protein [Kineosporia babensis]|uniref:Uncharacterized protein n=1 Tax=Kineosporia babensis TaxID=499548 RepID=A0A9X1SYJ9_9ACTN|nr:hypothetical protein [Kineosporia babensis]MCD5317004.1 hypothetical protein [Kineosporia babensis]